jgi:glutaconate CoA-transferase subunit B
MDFGGPEHQMRLRSLHPGVSVEQVRQATAFPVYVGDDVQLTPDPTPEQLQWLQRLDPHGVRAGALG